MTDSVKLTLVGYLGVHSPRLANTSGQPLETGYASYAQGLARLPRASVVAYFIRVVNLRQDFTSLDTSGEFYNTTFHLRRHTPFS